MSFEAPAPSTPPSWEELERLARADDIRDRAFATGELQLRYTHADDGERARARALYAVVRARAAEVHAGLRAEIRGGRLRGPRLRARLAAEPADVREHWIEEVLDIAHPPLDAPRLPRELIPYVPSGAGEILHMIDAVRLGPHDTLVDLGAGLGKVLMLAALLTGARGHGIELDAALASEARASAAALGISDVTFVQADAREADLDVGNIYYAYAPFTGAALDAVMDRLAPIAARRKITVCALAFDPRRVPWLVDRKDPSLWLNVYESR